MVKGVARRVVVVKSPDKRIFEEAIFIVRDDLAGKNGVSPTDVVREARRVVSGYVAQNSRLGRRLSRMPPLAFTAAGAGATGLVWLIISLL